MSKRSILLPIARTLLAGKDLMTTRVSHYIMQHKPGFKEVKVDHYWMDLSLVKDNGFHSQVNDYCFARMKTPVGFEEVRVLLNQHNDLLKVPKSPTFSEDILDWYEYVLKESPLRSAFTSTKRGMNYLKDGVRLNLKKDGTYLMAACTLLRFGYEFRGGLRTWKHLIDKGFTKNEAAVFAHFLFWDGKESYIISGGGGHVIFSTQVSKAGALAFCNDKLIQNSKTPASKKMMDWQVNAWLDQNTGDNELYNFLNSIKKVKGGGWNAHVCVDLNDEKILTKMKEWLK